jgi:hypothetical protein
MRRGPGAKWARWREPRRATHAQMGLEPLTPSIFVPTFSAWPKNASSLTTLCKASVVISLHHVILLPFYPQIKVLGFDANNKNLFLHNPEFPKELSTSNVVMVNRSLETYPRRPNMGITLPHKHWWLRRCSQPQGREYLGETTLAPPCTCTCTVITMSPRIPVPAKIAEVDGVG